MFSLTRNRFPVFYKKIEDGKKVSWKIPPPIVMNPSPPAVSPVPYPQEMSQSPMLKRKSPDTQMARTDMQVDKRVKAIMGTVPFR